MEFAHTLKVDAPRHEAASSTCARTHLEREGEETIAAAAAAAVAATAAAAAFMHWEAAASK